MSRSDGATPYPSYPSILHPGPIWIVVTMPGAEMVRPHDLRPGDVIRVAGEIRTVTSRPMPQLSDRRQRLVVTSDRGLVSWSIAEATYPQVERVARADRQAVA